MTRSICIIIFCLLSSLSFGEGKMESIFTKEIGIQTFDNNANFPSNEIHRIFQDREGFMWFASTNGLIRYDAYDFTLFKSDRNVPTLLTDNSITAIADDSTYLWIGTSLGLNKLDKKSKVFHEISNPIISGLNINQIVTESDSLIWIATNRGLIKYFHRTDSAVVYEGRPRDPFSLPSWDVKDIFLDSEGHLWIAMWNNGIFMYNRLEDNFIRYPRINVNNSISVIFEDNKKNIWLGSYGYGLYRIKNKYNPESVEYINYRNSPDLEHSISDNTIYSINQDIRYNYIWVGHRGGISILTDISDPSSFINYSLNSPEINLCGNDINAIYRDKDGIMWLGSMGGGVNKINLYKPSILHNSIENIKSKYGETFITYIYKINDHNYWFGIKNNGLFLYDAQTNQIKHSSEIQGLKNIPTDITVNTISYIKHLDELWIGIQDKRTVIIKPNKGDPYILTNTAATDIRFPDMNARCIYEDRANNIWICSHFGFTLITPSGKILGLRKLSDDKLPFYIQDMQEDDEGNIWFCTKQEGVIKTRYENGHLINRQYSKTNNKCNSNDILSIHIDPAKNIWIGSKGGGLSRFYPDKDRFVNHNYKYNIHYDDIFNIFSDSEGNLWMLNYYAILKLDVSRKKSVEIFNNETASGNVYSETSHPVQINRNFFLLPGIKGYDIISTKNMYVNTKRPQAIITDIEISNESIFKKNISNNFKFNEKEITLPHNKNNITILFTALSYSYPQKQNFMYRLQGFEGLWHNATANSRRAVYTNIPKGKYVFQLKASNENGLWNQKNTELVIKVKPPIYDTWYAWCAYIILSFLIVFTIIKIFLNKIRLQNEIRIKEMQQITSEELNQAKLKFFTNISHELLTPLSIVNCAIEEIGDSRKIDNKHIEIITNNINRLTRLIRQILEFRKAEDNKLKLKVSYGNLSSLISTIANTNFKPLANKKHLHFSVLSTPEDIIGWYDPDKLDKIMYNLLSNAFKYNKAGGYVQVSINEEKKEGKRFVRISVKDNGIGIDKKNLTHIFDKFYDGFYREQNTEGSGLGLSLTKTLTELHKGSIHVESELGKGSDFQFTIPIDLSSYNNDQIDSIELQSIQNGKKISEENNEKAENVESDKNSHKKKLLIVEDNEELIEIMSLSLQNMYRIYKAENGEKAISILEKTNIDIIISDIMMPGIDGLELCDRIRNNEEWSHIPIILLTAKNSEEDKIKGFEHGADAFITKPFKSKMLKVRISNLVAKREKISSNFRSEDTIKLKNITYTSIDEKFMEKAVEVVEEHIADTQFNFEIFVKEMNVSKSMLYRKLKNLTGMSSSEFIRNIRLKNACRILRDKNVNISEVAYTVGFNDPKYFTACFKKEFGILPTEYVKRFKKEEG